MSRASRRSDRPAGAAGRYPRPGNRHVEYARRCIAGGAGGAARVRGRRPPAAGAQAVEADAAAAGKPHRLPVPAAVVDRAGGDHDRPDAGLAVSVVHRYNLLQAPQWIGLENYVRMFTDDPRAGTRCGSRSPTCSCRCRCSWSFALAIAILLNEGMRGLLVLPLDLLPAVAARRHVAIAILWRQMFGTDGLVNQFLRAVRHRSHIGWISRPEHRAVDADPAARLDVRLTDGDLPGRPAADPGDVYEAASVDGAGRLAAVPLRSPCRCCPRSSSSTWCCR